MPDTGPSASSGASSGAARGGYGRVLVAEDNAVNRMVLTQLLDALGVDCDAVADGSQALAAIDAGDYALVIMDLNLPVMDGLEATRRIRASEQPGAPYAGRHLPVVALTGTVTEHDRQRCARAGMDDFLAKPISVDALRRTLGRFASPSSMGAKDAAPQQVSPVESEQTRRTDDVLDAGQLVSLADQVGDRDLVGVLVRTYLDELDARSQSLQQAYAEQRRGDVEVVAHTLKSSSALLGATRLSRLCADVESTARQGDLAGLEPTMADLEAARAATAVAMRDWLGAQDGSNR